MNYLLLITLWIVWCFLHSFFTTTKTTTWFKERLENKFAFYRVFYNLFSTATVLPLLYWQSTVPGTVIIRLSTFLLIFKYLALILSVVLMTGAFFSFDVREFFGIRQIISRAQKEQTIPKISKHGFFGIVRHPMYLGGCIFFLALMIGAPLAQFPGYCVLAVYMIIGTIREDRRLARELGGVYKNYQNEVPMFLPVFKRKKQ